MRPNQYHRGSLYRFYVHHTGGVSVTFAASTKRAREHAEKMYRDVVCVLPAPSPWLEQLPLDRYLHENVLKTF